MWRTPTAITTVRTTTTIPTCPPWSTTEPCTTTTTGEPVVHVKLSNLIKAFFYCHETKSSKEKKNNDPDSHSSKMLFKPIAGTQSRTSCKPLFQRASSLPKRASRGFLFYFSLFCDILTVLVSVPEVQAESGFRKNKL